MFKLTSVGFIMAIGSIFKTEKLLGLICMLLMINICLIIPVSNDVSTTQGDSVESSIPVESIQSQSSRTEHGWPKIFGGFTNTGKSNTYGPLTNNTLWKQSIGAEVFSSPTIAEGQLFVGAWDKRVYGFDAETGDELWQFHTGDYIYSSPTYHNGMVYIGTGIELGDSVRKLFAVDLSTSPVTTKWEHQFDGNIYGAAVVQDGVVYIGSADGYLYAMDEQGNGDGTTSVLRKFFLDGEVWSTPAIYENSIYIGSTESKLYRLNLTTFAEEWNFSADYSFEGMYGSATLDGSGRVFIGSAAQPNGRFYALDETTGTELWNISTGMSRYGVCTTAAVSDGTVFVGSNNGVMYALNAATGAQRWNFTTGDTYNGIYSSAAVSNGYIYFGSSDGKLYCLNELTGALVWEFETGGGEYGVISTPAVLDGRVYFGGNDGYIYVIGLPRTGEIQIDIDAEPNTLNPGDNATITVRTYNGSIALTKVKVQVKADEGRFTSLDRRSGSVNPAVSTSTRASILIGFTDLNGEFKCRYTAPQVDIFKQIELEVEASGEGLITNQSSTLITVTPNKILGMTMKASKASYYIGEALKVALNITENGNSIDSASVNYTISYNSNQYSKTFLWDRVGNNELEEQTPSVTTDTLLTITATARKQGFIPVTESITVTILAQEAFKFDIKITSTPEDVVTGKQTTIDIEVRNKTSGETLPGVVLKFFQTGGTVSTSQGLTDSSGKFQLTYTAPPGVTGKTIYIFSATATRIDYSEFTQIFNLTVIPDDGGVDGDDDGDDDSESFFGSPGFFAATAIPIIVVIVAVVILMQAKKKRLEMESDLKEDRVESKEGEAKGKKK